MFIHVVLFWCKEGTPEATKQEMMRYCNEVMPTVPLVKHAWAGKVVPSTREVVDSSYDFGLCVVFENKAGHDAYQPHELHQEYVKRFKPHWARIRVYDFE